MKPFLLSLTGTCIATKPLPQHWKTKQTIHHHPVINNLLIDM